MTRSRIRVELASPAYMGLEIIKIIILPCIHDGHAPVYAWNSHAQPPRGRNCLYNYSAMYTRLTRSCIRVELASPTYLWLGIV